MILVKTNNSSIPKKKREDIINDDRVSIQTCNTRGSSLFHGTSCVVGMDRSNCDSKYEEPDLICLDEGVTKQACNTGSSEISCNFSCRAGFSPDDEENRVITTCNTGK